MGKIKRSRRTSRKGVVIPDSHHKDDDMPDVDSPAYYNDEIDEFMEDQEKILLDGASTSRSYSKENQMKEVLAFDDSDDSDEDDDVIQNYKQQMKRYKIEKFKEQLESDIEDGDEEDSDDGEISWGRKKSRFYGADVDEDHRPEFDGDDLDDAEIEEQSALEAQAKLAAELSEADFELDMFPTGNELEVTNDTAKDEAIPVDLNSLTKEEKIKRVLLEAPEFTTLREEFLEKMDVVAKVLIPILDIVNEKKLPDSTAKHYVKSRMMLYLHYCMNIAFYFKLKASRAPTQNHPVMKRIAQYGKLVKFMEPIDARHQEFLYNFLSENGIENVEESLYQRNKPGSAVQQRKPAMILKKDSHQVAKSLGEMIGVTVPDIDDNSDDDKHRSDTSRVDAAMMDESEEEGGNEGVVYDADGKRAITKQIAKNRGLTPHRKKELKNPRVKHRIKYNKAKKRRKGAVREVRRELKPYGGELSGIRAGVTKSRKF